MSDRVRGPGYGPCCACEGEIAPEHPYVLMMPFRGPEGFTGWGCLQCHLPSYGAVAVLCQACMRAERQPKFIAGGKNVADNVRVPLAGFIQIPWDHDMDQHPELVKRRGKHKLKGGH